MVLILSQFWVDHPTGCHMLTLGLGRTLGLHSATVIQSTQLAACHETYCGLGPCLKTYQQHGSDIPWRSENIGVSVLAGISIRHSMTRYRPHWSCWHRLKDVEANLPTGHQTFRRLRLFRDEWTNHYKTQMGLLKTGAKPAPFLLMMAIIGWSVGTTTMDKSKSAATQVEEPLHMELSLGVKFASMARGRGSHG